MNYKGYKYLTYTKRLKLESLLKANTHKKKIAEILGVCLATVYNEIKRGMSVVRSKVYDADGDFLRYKDTPLYSADIAQNKFRLNMTAKGAPLKVGNDYDFVHYVEKRMVADKLSPGAILGEIKRKNMTFSTSISRTTLYRYIELGIFDRLCLACIKRKKKSKRSVTIKRAPRGTSIEQRPQEVAERNTYGHWEMDCVCGPTLSTLLVLSERLTRYEIIMPMPNQKAESVIRCLNVLERRYGKMFRKVFRTITVDNGSEFSDVDGIERSIYKGKRTSVYYCHPYTSCERGTNERLNREIRRQIPKGSALEKFSKEDIQAIEDWINAYPKRVLGYATSAELFYKEFQNLQ